MYGRIFFIFLLLGWYVGSYLTESEISEVMFNLETRFEEPQVDSVSQNTFLGKSVNYLVQGFGILAIGFLGLGFWIYQLFPIPFYLAEPIVLFLFFDVIFFGILSYFLINGLFAVILLFLERIGLLKIGGK